MDMKTFENMDKAFTSGVEGTIIKKLGLKITHMSDRDSMMVLNADEGNKTGISFKQLFYTFVYETDNKYTLHLHNRNKGQEEGLFVRWDKKVLVNFDCEDGDLDIYIFSKLYDDDITFVNDMIKITEAGLVINNPEQVAKLGL